MEKIRLDKLRNATLANLGMAIGSVGVFAATGNSAFMSEAIHDGADTGAHGSRYFAEKLGIDQDTRRFKWFLGASFLGVSALSAFTSYKIGSDLVNGQVVESSSRDSLINLGSAVSIGAGNTYAYKQIESVEEHSHASEASFNHAKVDMLASWGLVGFIIAGALSRQENVSTAGGMLFAGYTALHLAWHAIKPHKHSQNSYIRDD